MANEEHLKILKQGAAVWNQWYKENRNTIPDFEGANLSNTDLSNTDMMSAILIMANLSHANLSHANLNGADLRWADLSHANLNGIHLHETIFVNTNLKDAKGLENCIHHGPSTIDHRTLQKSDPLPLVFLRGCGLPDSLIEFLKALLSEPQYDSCFISYSSKDKDFVNKLYEDLRSRNVICWHDEHDLRGGKKLHEQINQAIKSQDRLLLVLSEHSMNSTWVKAEITEAYEREVTEKKRVLFPIRLVDMEKIKVWECFDSDTGVDLAKKVRDYFIPDFQKWGDPNSYQKSFEKLLSDLKSTT